MHDEIFTKPQSTAPTNPVEQFLNGIYGAPSQEELNKRLELKEELAKLSTKNVLSLHDINNFDIEIQPDTILQQQQQKQ